MPADGQPLPQTPPAPSGTPAGPSPTGPTPATMPVANRGLEAAALASVSLIVKHLTKVLADIGMGSEIGRDVHKAMGILSKHVPPGTVSSGIENSQAQKLMMQQRQMAPAIAAMRAMQGGGAQQMQMPPQGQGQAA